MAMTILSTKYCQEILAEHQSELDELGISLELGENWEVLASIFFADGIAKLVTTMQKAGV